MNFKYYTNPPFHIIDLAETLPTLQSYIKYLMRTYVYSACMHNSVYCLHIWCILKGHKNINIQ